MGFHPIYEIDIKYLYPLVTVIVLAGSELGNFMARREGQRHSASDTTGTLTAATLGILALMLGFSFSIAMGRFDERRVQALEEANGIGTVANYATMLPQPAQGRILAVLRDYTKLRITLASPRQPEELERDIAASVALQGKLWAEASALSAADPRSLPVYRFVAALNDMTNIHERRISALRFLVPSEVLIMLVVVAVVGMIFTGYYTGNERRMFDRVLAVLVAMLIMLIVDLDRPTTGLIRVPVQALEDALAGIPG